MEFNRLLSSAISAYGEPGFSVDKDKDKIKKNKVQLIKKILFNKKS